MEVEVLPSPIDVIRSHKHFRIKNTSSTKSLFNVNITPFQAENRGIPKKPSADYYSELPSPVQDKNILNKLKRYPSAALAIKQLNRQKTEEGRVCESLDKAVNRARGNTDIQQQLMKNFMSQKKGAYSLSRKASNESEQIQIRNFSYQERNYETAKPDEDQYRMKKKSSAALYQNLYQSLDAEQYNAENERHNREVREARDSPTLVLPKICNKFEPKDLVFAPNVKEHIYRKHALDVAQGIKYATKQVKAPPMSHIVAKQVILKSGRNTLEKTLVLDLDETLITSKVSDNEKNFIMINVEESQIKVMVRPYAREFLAKMSKEFEIIVFTAADKSYAESVVKMLDPHQKYISHILHRDHCLKTKKGVLIKDLRIIKDRELKNMVIVDNFTPSFSFQIGNGIPIITWKGETIDEELKYLMDYLLEAKTYDDMRVFNRERLRLEDLGDLSADKFAYGNM